ncbi:MAG: phasin family protein [Qingshengfaniella sp.]
MAGGNPYDFSDMFRMFDPASVTSAFDPMKMFAMFEQRRAPDFDLTGVIDMNRRNFEALVDANKAAAEAYKDLLEKQMEVFAQMTSAARDHVQWVDEAAGPDALNRKTEAYGEAVEKALHLMRKLADTARDANEAAYQQIKDQLGEAIGEISKQGAAAAAPGKKR